MLLLDEREAEVVKIEELLKKGLECEFVLKY